MVRGPRREVFTTLLVNAHNEVADWPQHWQRIQKHAQRLRMTLGPLESAQLESMLPHGLVRLAFGSESGWSLTQRQRGLHDEPMEAITLPAPRWTPNVNGTKHGQWEPYLEARAQAEDRGCDVALFVHDHALVDADRGTPMLLDEDGTVWLPHLDDGGVDGVVAAWFEQTLPNDGYPVQRGRLNERLVARCNELVVVGTGLGVVRIDAIDGEPMGGFTAFSEHLQQRLSEHYSQPATWTPLGPRDE